LIELTREKRAFEYALPPTSDEGNFLIRRLLMEQQETLEWKRREDEIRKLENERIDLIRNVLFKRDEEREEAMNERIEKVRNVKNEEKDKKNRPDSEKQNKGGKESLQRQSQRRK